MSFILWHPVKHWGQGASGFVKFDKIQESHILNSHLSEPFLCEIFVVTIKIKYIWTHEIYIFSYAYRTNFTSIDDYQT